MVEGSDKPDGSGQDAQQRECMACRGSGRVISKLGGDTSLVTCPWCDGSGTRTPGIDAQARWPRNPVPGQGDAAPAEASEPSREPTAGG